VFVGLHGGSKHFLCLYLSEIISCTRHMNCTGKTSTHVFVKSRRLIKHDGMNTYGGSGGIYPPIPNPAPDEGDNPTQHCPKDPHDGCLGLTSASRGFHGCVFHRTACPCFRTSDPVESVDGDRSQSPLQR
jgi:hypothetical protein